MAFENITLQCVDCGNDFEFTAGEQEFFQEKGLVNTPKRCSQCRNARKRMSNKKPQRRLYDVVCSECGTNAKVPFRPSDDKPVYCKSCFENYRSSV